MMASRRKKAGFPPMKTDDIIIDAMDLAPACVFVGRIRFGR
jgi:hypothetical protein